MDDSISPLVNREELQISEPCFNYSRTTLRTYPSHRIEPDSNEAISYDTSKEFLNGFEIQSMNQMLGRGMTMAKRHGTLAAVMRNYMSVIVPRML
jgi:hypothetical protein